MQLGLNSAATEAEAETATARRRGADDADEEVAFVAAEEEGKGFATAATSEECEGFADAAAGSGAPGVDSETRAFGADLDAPVAFLVACFPAFRFDNVLRFFRSLKNPEYLMHHLRSALNASFRFGVMHGLKCVFGNSLLR